MKYSIWYMDIRILQDSISGFPVVLGLSPTCEILVCMWSVGPLVLKPFGPRHPRYEAFGSQNHTTFCSFWERKPQSLSTWTLWGRSCTSEMRHPSSCMKPHMKGVKKSLALSPRGLSTQIQGIYPKPELRFLT